jgi:hypothetical protein
MMSRERPLSRRPVMAQRNLGKERNRDPWKLNEMLISEFLDESRTRLVEVSA